MLFRKRLIAISCAVLVWTLAAALGGFAQQEDDLQKFPTCTHCRMERKQYAPSRMLLTHTDGTECAFCSLHCLALELVIHTDKNPNSVRVADYNTGALIDAETASWVLGGIKKGVMTERAKWAFKSKKEADEFIRQNGGEHVVFEQALEAAYQDMYTDSKVIRNRMKIRNMIDDLEMRSPAGMNRPSCCGR